ncbi:MAG: hypothetical protein WDN04_03565 [Rhodospirillales bacterium]
MGETIAVAQAGRNEGAAGPPRRMRQRRKTRARTIIDNRRRIAEATRSLKHRSGNRRRQHDKPRILYTKVLCFFLSRKKSLLF